jgi:hypothetical protein
MSSRGQRAQGPWTVASFVALATLTLIIFWSVGAQFLDWFSLDLGSITTMSAGYTYFLLFWCLFGAIAAVFFTLAFAHLAGADWAQETYAQLRATSDRHLMLAFSAIAFALPALLYWRLFQGVHLTDDESVYRFSAELLASGRLYADSPPMKLFFDHVFMINDGKFYSQYFMGWPALLAPWVALRVPELANPMYSALTVPAIFSTLRELAGRRCAVIGVLLFVSAPMIHFTAATQLSHTSCLFALAWMTYLTLRANRGDSSWWLHPGIAVTFSVAFFIRPTVALGMGVPLLFVWAVSIRRISPQQRLGAVLGFAAPALLFGGAFFAVNALQNGSIGYVAYQRAADYARENGFHFSAWSSLSDDWTPSFGFESVGVALARTGVALTRVNFALLGWPCAFLFLPFAPWQSQKGWVLWAMGLGFTLVHFNLRSAGIDTFGPVHYAEIALPILMLSALGVARLTSSLRNAEPSAFAARIPVALCFGLIVATAFGYVPVRARALYELSDVIRRPTVASREIAEPAIVFAYRPFVPRRCASVRHFVFAHEVNDPDFENPILWVNHLSIEHDQQLMRRYPDRKGFVMLWGTDCQPTFLPLTVAKELGLPDAKTGSEAAIPSPEEMR